MKWLANDHCSLPIPVEPSSIQFMHTPTQFYEKLNERIRTAKKRIVLASLYLGTGPLEQALVANIEHRIDTEQDLKVNLLLDFFRGTRTKDNEGSVKLLQPLAEKAQINFFHHPDMRGLLLNLLPERINEIIGLQHMKFFIFDDAIIISGANLSDSYFTNRQDRYILVEDNPLLVDFFVAIADVISSCSLTLNADGQLIFGGDADLHPFTEFRKVMTKKLEGIFASFKEKIGQQKSIEDDTFLCPFMQMGSFDMHQEVDLLTRLFGYPENDIEITLSTGYFNLYENYIDLILRKSKCPITILLASPEANGFYNGSGLSGYIPSLYVHNSQQFYRQASLAASALNKRGESIALQEYSRPNWTFHAKGIWISSKVEKMAATIIGSSNYGYRSVFRDLEVGALLVTRNERLMRQIMEEKKAITEFCNPIEPTTFLRKDHYVPMWIKHSSRFIRHFF